ncbi:hypothetical protein V9T40_000539 [Parthenolecanium corni]|uniref:Solute carrier family 35 member B1 n=1 Tax=Parthenolecanium corni TaxID=536013 RepID=A0AAN9Y1Q3_9HEMI
MDRRLKFLICTGGIFLTYFYYGIIQEKITRGNYGNEKFTSMLSMILIQCVVNYLFAVFTSSTVLQQGEDTTRTIYYVSCALTYLLAMLCSTLALKWVNYPTQVIGKSAKPIPVMILGVLLGRRSYPLRKYCFVLLVVVGVALFMYKDSKAGPSNTIFGYGEMMILFSLLMDGLTGAIQERMRSESRTKSGHLMMNMNKWSIVFLSAVVLVSGEYVAFFDFTKRHPAILWELVSFSAASAFGQFFIFLTVSDFGPLPCSIVTTTRKFFTVLGSVLFFGNVLLPRQWLATSFVFTGLFLDAFFR